MAKIILKECPGCGSKNKNNKKYCGYCGKLLEESIVENISGEQELSLNIKDNPGKSPDTYIQTSSADAGFEENQSPDKVKTNQMKALSSLAIASFILAFFPIFWLIALILGIIANVSISKPDLNLRGRGFSTAAIIMSSLGILSSIIIIIIIIASGIALGAIGISN
ncbi:MAG: hypothetical protein PHU65_07595 [Actinomycetota bacterium]|nr:hypothetical protein [Actinomycetota bacterium]